MRTGTVEVNFHYLPSKEFPYFFTSPCVKTDPVDDKIKYDHNQKHHALFFESAAERDIEQKKYENKWSIKCYAGRCVFDGEE